MKTTPEEVVKSLIEFAKTKPNLWNADSSGWFTDICGVRCRVYDNGQLEIFVLSAKGEHVRLNDKTTKKLKSILEEKQPNKEWLPQETLNRLHNSLKKRN